MTLYSVVGTMKDMTKTGGIKVRLDAQDRARLEALAEHYALTIGAVVRMLAKREVDALGLRLPKTRHAKSGARGRR